MEGRTRVGQPLEIPEIDDYLIDDFWAFGPSRILDSGGEIPIGDQELFYFTQTTGTAFDRFERDALIAMSRGYCTAKNAGQKQAAIAPVDETGDTEKDRRTAISKGFKAVLGAASKKGGDTQ